MNHHYLLNAVRAQVDSAIRHLFSEQNRDPYSRTYGCFDRRYWGWKLVDYPEATFQRNVYPMAWLLEQTEPTLHETRDVLTETIKAGLQYTIKIQHRDGSFDQAFPNEHSYGATAFLVHPLLKAYQVIKDNCSDSFQNRMDESLNAASLFLCRKYETHGYIANHLAGAALSLLSSADYFRESAFERHGSALLEDILNKQSGEGWFIEYDGADPGYQTLCLYYLAQIYHRKRDARLQTALERALSFLSWFVHPDGTFGGDYGSRRTSIYYPGGIARLCPEHPLAARMTHFMLDSIKDGRTVTLADIDMGNLAPLLSNYILLLEADLSDATKAPMLPCEKEDVCKDFDSAGMHIRGTKRYYAIVGTSNGGVLKIFNRKDKAVIHSDSGYVGQMHSGHFITTQVTHANPSADVKPGEIRIRSPFFKMTRTTPSPFLVLIFRIMNLTVMRSKFVRERIKYYLAHWLIRRKTGVPLTLTRIIRFTDNSVAINDRLDKGGRLGLRWLEHGRLFNAIHMASSLYFENVKTSYNGMTPRSIDVERLSKNRTIELETIV